MFVFGGKAFNVHKGQYVAFSTHTSVCDFYYTMLTQAFGIQVSDFNGHKNTLPGLFD
jgi:hypothetical protein